MPALLAAFGEEGLDHRGAIGGEDTGNDLDLMVEAGIGKDLETSTNRAALGVVGSVDQARDASLNDRAGAHAARLDGDVEGGAREAVIAETARGFAKDDDFGVGRGVIVANGAVAGAREDFAFMDEDSADRNFARSGRGAGLGQGFLHELRVGFHSDRESYCRRSRGPAWCVRRVINLRPLQIPNPTATGTALKAALFIRWIRSFTWR
jgi:hypothetical protein